MPKMRPANASGPADVRAALDSLRFARDCLQRADCPQALAIVRRAIKSTEGAYRHALRRVSATERRAQFKALHVGLTQPSSDFADEGLTAPHAG